LEPQGEPLLYSYEERFMAWEFNGRDLPYVAVSRMLRLIWSHMIGSGGCHPGRNMKSNIQRVRQRSEPHGLGRRRHQAAYHPNLKYDVRTSVLQAVLEVDCSSCSTVELCLLPSHPTVVVQYNTSKSLCLFAHSSIMPDR
jgi:hypothetical protein